jgi:predicted SAM-dependent methyltransferase
MIKKIVKKCFNVIGYELKRKKITEDSLYTKIYPLTSLQNKNFYNIGAGNFFQPYWTNIDFSSEWYSKSQKNDYINYNLFSLKPLPIDDETAEILYASHVIEHISDGAVQNLFNEAYRILKPKEIFRIITPDIVLLYRALKGNDLDFFNIINQFKNPNEYHRLKIKIPLNKASIEQKFLYEVASQLSFITENFSSIKKVSDDELNDKFQEMSMEDALDFIISKTDLKVQNENPGFHINWFTEEKIRKMLKIAGFTNLFRSGWGQSTNPILRNTDLFDTTHPEMSLYFEAIK